MHDFHYNYIKKKYNANLFFTDTYSLVYEIETEEIYEDFYRHKNLFDFRYYQQDSKFFNPINQKVIGKMKDEFKAKIINEFSGLKSKMYYLVTVGNEEIKKAKGVNKNTVKNAKHKEYVDALFNKDMIRHRTKMIRSKLHRIGTYDVCKISLSCFDDKRYILNNGIFSLFS